MDGEFIRGLYEMCKMIYNNEDSIRNKCIILLILL